VFDIHYSEVEMEEGNTHYHPLFTSLSSKNSSSRVFLQWRSKARQAKDRKVMTCCCGKVSVCVSLRLQPVLTVTLHSGLVILIYADCHLNMTLKCILFTTLIVYMFTVDD